jgi:hypothetical protein
LEIGLWKIDGFEKVGRSMIPPPICHKIHHKSSSAGMMTRTPSSKSSHPKPRQLFLLVKTNTLIYYPWSLTPMYLLFSGREPGIPVSDYFAVPSTLEFHAFVVGFWHMAMMDT